MLSRQEILIAAAAAVLLVGPVHAAPIIEFSTGSAGEGGTITWDGTNLKGADIPIGAVTISGAPTNNGVFPVIEGRLYFNTGSTGVLVADYWTALHQNWVIVGCVPDLGIQSCGLFSHLALGTIQVWDQELASQGLLGALGATQGVPWYEIGLSEALGAPLWSFSGSSIATHTLNADGTPETVSHTRFHSLNVVPEPTTMILLGTGLLAAFQARRRRRP